VYFKANTNQSLRNRWQSAWQDTRFRHKTIAGGVLLLGCAIVAPLIFAFVQQRPGSKLNDLVLNWLPTLDLSGWIFSILYGLILLSLISLATSPKHFLLCLYAYSLVTLFRFGTLLLLPLEPPEGMATMPDPFVQYLFYQQIIDKDLFFSGHTSILIIMALTVPHSWLKKVLAAGSVCIAMMLLVQHIHYTIDVLAAPLFAWLAYYGSIKFLE